MPHSIAGWSSPVARQAHNLKVVSSNLAPATKETQGFREIESLLFYPKWDTGGTLKKNNARKREQLTTSLGSSSKMGPKIKDYKKY